MGSGQIKSQPCFYVYEEQGEGEFTIKQYDSDVTNVVPNLKNGEQPYAKFKLTNGGNVISCKLYVPSDYIMKKYQKSFK